MDGNMQPALGLYLSIPFCRCKCTYCNFSSGVYPASEHTRYVARLIEDLRGARASAAKLAAELPGRIDSIYLGGGTPSLLGGDLLRELFAAIRGQLDVDPKAEITMECAPGQVSGETLTAMAACGVNRVSLGVQSFVDAEAHQSGRLHDRKTVEEDLRRLRAAGITKLNVDLIAGLAGQTFDSWEYSLNTLIEAGAPHASIYMLEVDDDSRLGRELLAGGARYSAGLVPHDDAIARMYERGIERLAEADMVQYEISNFARAGFESIHNLRYWQRKPYLGLGLDASSMLRASADTLRWTTTDDLRAYLDEPSPPAIERISVNQQHEEAWFLGLRLNEGVDIAALNDEFGSSLVDPALITAQHLCDDGMLTIESGRVRLTAKGRLLSNEVFQEFIADPEGDSTQLQVGSGSIASR